MAIARTPFPTPGRGARVWSPHTTMEYARCPRRARLLREGWGVTGDDDGEYLAMGVELHTRLTAEYRGNIVPVGALTPKQERTVEWAFERCVRTFPADTMLAIPCVDQELNPMYPRWTPDERWGRPDLVYADKAGLHVVDWKLRKRMPDMTRLDWDWQMHHYAAFAQALWARQMGDVVDYTFAFTVCEPTLQFVTHTTPVTVARLAQWVTQAESVWSDMRDTMDEWEPKWTGCNLPYYQCEFTDHCHKGAQLEQFYVKREREERV